MFKAKEESLMIISLKPRLDNYVVDYPYYIKSPSVPIAWRIVLVYYISVVNLFNILTFGVE